MSAEGRAREIATVMTVAANRHCLEMADLRYWADEMTTRTWPTQRGADIRRAREILSRQARQQAKGAVQRLWQRLDRAVASVLATADTDDPDNEDGGQHYPVSPELLIASMMLHVDEEEMRDGVAELRSDCNDDPELLRYAVLYAQSRYHEHSQTAGKLLLSPTIAAFEELLAALVRQWYTLHPREPGLHNETVSLEDLARYSREDIFRRAVDKKVDRFVDRPPGEWAADLKKSLDIDLPTLIPDWASLVEGIARRHAFVHAGGRADQKYLSRLPADWQRPELGAPLECDQAYMQHLLATVEFGGVTVSVAFLKQFAGDSVEAPELAAHHVPRALHAGLWHEAKVVATAGLRGQPRDHEHHELRVNLWMARRELGESIDALRAEVEAWVVPDEPRYRLAVAALLLDETATLARWRECEAAADKLGELADWPLLLDMARRHPKLRAEIARAKGRQATAAKVQRRDATRDQSI